MTYRNLEDNEVIQVGDEFLHPSGAWQKVLHTVGRRTSSMDLPRTKWRRPVKTGFITRDELDARIDAGIFAKYNELIMAVTKVFPGETRHQTALRYIREREEQSAGQADNAQAALVDYVEKHL